MIQPMTTTVRTIKDTVIESHGFLWLCRIAFRSRSKHVTAASDSLEFRSDGASVVSGSDDDSYLKSV